MATTTTSTNNLVMAIDWLDQIIAQRISDPDHDTLVAPPTFQMSTDPFTHMIRTYEPTYAELVILVLAFTPHISAGRLDGMISGRHAEPTDLAVAGGIRGIHHRGMLPTGETALWLLAGNDVEARAHVARIFRSDHWFARDHVLTLEHVAEGEPLMSGRLLLDAELVERMIHGTVTLPRFSSDFPAEHLTTEMNWDDLILPQTTEQQIAEILNWMTWNDTVMREWGMQKRIKPGYRALFHGPPGTGKTLAATLLGKHTDRDVFRVDLSRVVSKYIGETEKNLASLFDRAENKRWILFFDEADALFGKRTDIRDAHDKYANQEVAYLLQRIETFHGLVILATNQRGNIDDAFIRRFHSIVHFSVPNEQERMKIWAQNLPPQLPLDADVDLGSISSRYELSGAAILNVIHHCSIECLADGATSLAMTRLELAIHRELVKSGKVI